MKQPKCLNPKCKITAKVRGLCFCCYIAACRFIKAEQTTWKELEKAGKCLPKAKTRTSKTKWLIEGL